MRILVIEDDESTAQVLAMILTTHHYVVEVAASGQAGLALLESFEYDLLILDVGLPDVNGIDLCRQVRMAAQSSERSQFAQIPILLLTAQSSHHDRARGLDAGADDYIIKPFDVEELVARIRALLRRASSTATPLLAWEHLQLNPSTFEVTYRSQPIALTPKEYGLLELFLRNRRRVFSCSHILERLWTYEDAPGEEAVRTHIKGLRHKLKSAGAPADLIETVYGIGYRLKPLSSVSPDEFSTTTSVEQELRSKLSAVWSRYKDRISEQIAVIEQVGYRTEWSIQSQAARQAHTLAQVLSTFGYAAGSELAQKIEQILASESLKPEALQQLQELTAALRRVIDLPALSGSSAGLEREPKLHQPLILGVSNDRAFLNALERELPKWNYQIVIAATPKAIAKICENDAPNLVLLDLDCFDSHAAGLSLLSSLQHYSSPISAIVLTTQNDLAERLQVARHGGQRLLQKTTPISQILEAINQVLQRALPTQTKILVVDSDPTLLEAATTLLKPWGFNVFTLANPHRFWDTLEAIAPDVLVLGLEFPDLSGIDLCQVVRSDLRWSHLPVVILTAHSEAETINQVFAAGADDFVSKPIVGAELVARILNRLDRVKLLRYWMETDPLTGVANRQKSTQELEVFLRSADHAHTPVAIAVLDVDRLRDVNAVYGHAAGDAVLRQFGQLLRQSFWSEDVLARWGGEEFVIGMYGMTREDGVQRLIRVLEHLNQQAFTTDTGAPLQVTFSAGVAQYPEDGRDLNALYRAADAALRQAKRLRQETGLHSISSILPAETITSLQSSKL